MSTIYSITAKNGFGEIVFTKKVCSCIYCDEIVAKLHEADDAVVITVIDDLTGEVIVDDDKTEPIGGKTLAAINEWATIDRLYEEYEVSPEEILDGAVLRSTIH